jgi:hypothetical protein
MKTTTVRSRNSIQCLSLRRGLSLIPVVLTCVALLERAHAVTPPPDGGYGGNNTAEGTDALFNLTTGVWNSAVGFRALYKNAAGIRNVAVGYQALYNNNGPSNDHYAGFANVAVGANALFNNRTGNNNVAIGDFALYDNTTGSNNIAIGSSALRHSNGDGLTVIGDSFASAIDSVSIGRLPVYDHGGNIQFPGVLTASMNAQNDIYIGSLVNFVPQITYTSRVHVMAQDAVYVGAVFGNPIAGSTVNIDSNGQLGVAPSSARFKTDIAPMDKQSEALLALKPVTFHYKKEIDRTRAQQFGLVAEQVEKVNADLVVHDRDGKPYSVRYDAVNAMLLNEFLKEHRKVEKLESTIAELDARLKEQDSKIQNLSDQVAGSKSLGDVAVNQ